MAEHDYFGVIDESGTERWTEQVEANDQLVAVSVWVEAPATDDALDRAAAMVMSLDAIDSHAREQLVAELASHATPTSQFVALAIAEIDDDDLVAALDRESGDRAIDILRSLQLDTAIIRPDQAGDDEAFCTLRYSFVPDSFEMELVAVLDARAESADIRLERW
ncbi:MAG: hypothetical protein ACOYBP_07985 [Microbacteriaceae bacterium]